MGKSHITDWHPGRVSEEYTKGYDKIKWGHNRDNRDKDEPNDGSTLPTFQLDSILRFDNNDFS